MYNRAQSTARTYSDDSEWVELYFSGRQLKNMDTFSLTDAQIILHEKFGKTYSKIGQTEVVWDNLNPDFTTSFKIEFVFEKHQYFKVELRDIDNKAGTKWEDMGFVEFELGKMMGSRNSMLILDIAHKGTKMGKIVVRGEVISRENYELSFTPNLSDLENFCFFRSPKPILVILKPKLAPHVKKMIESGEDYTPEINSLRADQWIRVYQSKQYKGKKVRMSPVKINSSKLCGGSLKLPIKIEWYQQKSSGKHKLKGFVIGTAEDLLTKSKQFNLTHQRRKERSGVFQATNSRKNKVYQFGDYLRGGMNISVISCIDFTGSNGVPSRPDSLHYMRPGTMNQYQQAIRAVCDILLNYDEDKQIPVYGFGAKTRFPNMMSSQTVHFFPCSGDYQNCAGYGVEGVFQLYNHAIQNVELSGPTHFNPLLTECIKFTEASAQADPDSYTVLLILTDGCIHDMDPTISSLVYASTLPMSVIIIGIGNADFTNMEILDGDDVILTDYRGRKAVRDIVQFVAFNDFKNKHIDDLAAEVLRELPRQVVNYYKMNERAPNLPRNVNMDDLLLVRQNVGAQLLQGIAGMKPAQGASIQNSTNGGQGVGFASITGGVSTGNDVKTNF